MFMNINHLRYFLAVAETGNFSRAAERCFISQPALSAAIAKLEQDLGASLFERGRRTSTLSAEGERFSEHARRVLSEIEAARRELSALPPPETLNIGVISSFPFARLSVLAAEFGARSPGTRLRIVEGRPQELSRRLSAGRIDLAITLSGEAGPDRRPLFRDRLAAFACVDDPICRRPTLNSHDLHERALVIWTAMEGLSEARRILAAREIRPVITLRTGELAKAVAAVEAGLGIGLLPDSVDTAARRIELNGIDVSRSFVIETRSPAPQGPAEQFTHLATRWNWRPFDKSPDLDIAH